LKERRQEAAVIGVPDPSMTEQQLQIEESDHSGGTYITKIHYTKLKHKNSLLVDI